MRTNKTLTIFIFFAILVSSCFSPPEFSIIPEISYNDIIFKKSTTGGADSLIVYIDFKDGDGDLGLSATQIDAPYHPINFYLENNGDTIPLTTSAKYADLPAFIDVPAGAVGKLVTVRTREDFPDLLPPYVCPYSATAYLRDSVFISEENKDIFDESTHHLFKTYKSNVGNPDVYVLLDTFYYRPNKNHDNIDIEFYIRNNDDSYTLFDWKTEYCGAQDFSQRFPILTDTDNPLAGTLKYAMTSLGFEPTFAGRKFKLKVRIRDRALHESNTIETPSRSLDEIMR